MTVVRRPRISILSVVSPDFPAIVDSGCEAVLARLIGGFASLALSVDVYYYDYSTVGPARTTYPYANVAVRPIPAPFASGPQAATASPVQSIRFVRSLRRICAESDIVYMHGSGGGGAYTGRHFVQLSGARVVTSVHDLVYDESIQSALETIRGPLVAVSEYLGHCLIDLTSALSHSRHVQVTVVNNGYNQATPARSAIDRVREGLGLAPDVIPILFPHRPDPLKGIDVALKSMAILQASVEPSVAKRLKLLIPRKPGAEFQAKYRAVTALAKQHGVREMVGMHRWLPLGDMPAYLALGSAVLCVGEFPESFGNLQVEAVLAGTPPVLSRVGAQRSIFSDDLVRKVDPKDPQGVAQHLVDIIQTGERVDTSIQQFARDAYGSRQMVDAYARILLDGGEITQTRSHGDSPLLDLDARTLSIPPWCANLRSGYWSDYTGYVRDPVLTAVAPLLSTGPTVGSFLGSAHASRGTLESWLALGHVVAKSGTAMSRDAVEHA